MTEYIWFSHSRKHWHLNFGIFHAITLESVADWPNCRLCQNLDRKNERMGERESDYEKKKKKMTLIADCCAADYCWQSTHSLTHTHTRFHFVSLSALQCIFHVTRNKYTRASTHRHSHAHICLLIQY